MAMRLLAPSIRLSSTKANPRALSRATASLLRSRNPTSYQFSTDSQHTISSTPKSPPYSRSLVVAGCALVGLWSATGFVYMTNSPVHLDSDATEPALDVPQGRTSNAGSVGGSAAHAADVDQELRRYEKTYIPPLNSDISRYDIVRLARSELWL